MLDLLFIGLVVLDGFLTRALLQIGATEANFNPMVLWSLDHLWARVLIAIAIVLLLRYFGKWKLLHPLCFVCLGICVYNGVMLLIGKMIVTTVSIFD